MTTPHSSPTRSARGIPALALLLAVCGSAPAAAQRVQDPPWNPQHISNLPADVRSAVLAMCATTPNAGHYFATYTHNSQELNLHFEHLHCEQAKSFCNSSGCLHQVYLQTAGHHRLARSFYGSGND
jgi:hypothetical protein